MKTTQDRSYGLCVINLGPSFELFVMLQTVETGLFPLPFTVTKKAKETHPEEEGSINADFYKGVALSKPHKPCGGIITLV